MEYKPSVFDLWSREEFDACFEKIYQEYSAGVTADGQKPKVLFVSGFSGAGKSSFAGAYHQEHPNFLRLSVDDIVARSPDYEPKVISLNQEYTDEEVMYEFGDLLNFAGMGASYITSRARQKGINVILDGFAGNALARQIELFDYAGYEMSAAIICSPKRLNDVNIISRSIISQTECGPQTLQMNRTYIPHDLVNKKMQECAAMEKAGVRLQIINPADKRILYDTENGKGNPSAVFCQEFYRDLTNDERKELKVRQNFLRRKINSMNCSEGSKRFYQYAVNSCSLPYKVPYLKTR